MLIYLLQYIVRRVQYIVKSESQFNIRLKNHHKNINIQASSLVDQHIKIHRYNFNQHVKLALKEQLEKINTKKRLRLDKLNH